jgi:collagenase-like PrtC family protease
MSQKLSFSLATNFQDDLLEGLKGTPVDTLYGRLDPDPIGGGRSSFSLPWTPRHAVERHISRAAAQGLGFNYLLNAACLGSLEQSRRGQRQIDLHLDWLASLPITGITVASPYLLRRIKVRAPHLKVRISVFAQVDRVAKARQWEEMGADTLVLDSLLVNRDFSTLEAIRKAVNLEIELLASNSCILDCALSPYHMTTLAHSSKSSESGGASVDWCFLRCGHQRLLEPHQYLRADWIRPEDLERYQELGYHRFKLTERGAPTEVLIRRVHAYANRHYEGNLLDLVQPFGYASETPPPWWERLGALLRKGFQFLRPWRINPLHLEKLATLAKLRGLLFPLEGAPPVTINNQALDGFLKGWPRRGCQDRNCEECGYCQEWSEKAVHIDPEFRKHALELYQNLIDHAEDGSLWLLRPSPRISPPRDHLEV